MTALVEIRAIVPVQGPLAAPDATGHTIRYLTALLEDMISVFEAVPRPEPDWRNKIAITKIVALSDMNATPPATNALICANVWWPVFLTFANGTKIT